MAEVVKMFLGLPTLHLVHLSLDTSLMNESNKSLEQSA
jgi:hypothetical protein